jgi:hypothetical protein
MLNLPSVYHKELAQHLESDGFQVQFVVLLAFAIHLWSVECDQACLSVLLNQQVLISCEDT